MKEYGLKLGLLIIFMACFSIFLSAEKKSPKDLPQKYRKWLEEDVVYIITPKEKEVFLQLETDNERSVFMEAFWKHRNPTPGTPDNEYKREHSRRVNHANHRFGIGSPKSGWKTDRGRIYIILGEPMSIETYESSRELRDTEIWFYQDMTKYGLPNGFNVVFYRKGMAGDYEIYSPVSDGPHAFFIQTLEVDPADYLEAYYKLNDINPAIAGISMSLIPGDMSAVSGRPSLASELLLQNINLKPQKEVDDLYARKFLDFKGIVGVEYSTNYISCDYIIQPVRDSSSVFFIHYLVAPERFSVGKYDNNYNALFILNGRVTDLDDKLIYQFEKEFSANFDEDKARSIANLPFQINDMFPLISGDFKFSLLIKNIVSKEFSSFENEISVPNKIDTMITTTPLLCYSTKNMESGRGGLVMRPFQVDDTLLFCDSRPAFLTSDRMTVFFQLLGFSPELVKSGNVLFSIQKGEQEVKTITRALSEYSNPGNIIEEIPLSEFIPENYILNVSVQDQTGEIIQTLKKNFFITHGTSLPRPFIQTKTLPAANYSLNNFRIGRQFYNSGKYAEAAREFETALRQMPEIIDFATSLAQTYFILGRYDEAEAVLTPFLSREDVKYEVLFCSGRAAKAKGDYQKAIQHFRKAMSHFGLNTNLLNLIGECHIRLSQISEARAAWKKSLEINPDQPDIRKNLEGLKNRK